MADQAIGTARVDIVVNTDTMEPGVAKAKRNTDDIAKAAKNAADSIEQNSRRQVAALEKGIATFGKSRDEVLRWRIAQQTSGETAARLNAALDKQVASLAKGNQVLDHTGMSAKQLAFATRGLPAQFTDIATSLASGQKPLLVLLQQGGQIKDQFGGAGAALKAMGTYVVGLINPVTLLVAAAAGLAAAWEQGADEARAYTRVLALTGNAAAVTTAQLEEMAVQIDKSSTATQHEAASALAQVAQTGRFTGDQLEIVAKAALELQQATGRSIGKTVEDFISLQDKPVEAILKLNGAIGDGTNVIRFLTPEQLKLIENLQKQGKEAEAAAIAIEAYANAIGTRTPQVVQNLGTIETVWKVIKQTAAEAWDEMLGIGREQTITQQIAGLQQQIARGMARGFATADLEEQLRRLQTQSAGLGSAQGRGGHGAAHAEEFVDTKKAQAALDFDKEALRFATDKVKMERDIADIRAQGLRAGKSELEIEKAVAAIRADYARKAPKGPHKTDPTDTLVDQLKRQIGLNKEQAESEDKLTTSERLRVSVETQLKELGTKATTARRALIASLLTELDTTGQLAEKQKLEIKAKEDLRVLNVQLSQQEQDQQRANEEALAAFGHGEKYLAQARRKLAIERQYDQELQHIRENRAGKTDEQLKREEDALAASRDRMLREEENFQRQWDQAQGSWVNGALKAIEDYRDRAADVAGQMSDIWSNAFNGLEDVLTQFFTKGKADWKGFFEALDEDIVRFLIRQQLTGWLEKLEGLLKGGASGGGGGGWISSLLGALFGIKSNPVQAMSNGSLNLTQGFASGTDFAPGGMAIVGERGPELVNLPRGSQVIPNHMLSGAPGAVQVEVNIHNNNGGTARTEQRTEGGKQIIDVFIEAAKNAVAQDIGRNGPVGKAISSRFGVAPAGVVRG